MYRYIQFGLFSALRCSVWLCCAVVATVATTTHAEEVMQGGLSDAEIEQNLQQAREAYAAQQAERKAIEEAGEPDNVQIKANPFHVNLTPEEARIYHADGIIENLPLGRVLLAIDVEQMTIEDIVNLIMREAAPASGPWQVRWRLKPENSFILDEKVNLTAETTMNQFLGYMVEHINNLTGVKLFVTQFEQSRLIILSDTVGRG